jgi:thiosulfate/3-mercaptopyruvate sulfurtransferase
VDLDDPIPTQLAPPEKLEACMARLGVGAHSVVVAYDSYSHMFAGRLRWALRAYGFDNVFVLEGGWGTWCREGRPVETGEPVDGGEDERNPPALHDIPPFRARAVSALRATKDDVVNVVRGSRSALLVDARSPAQYRGETSAAARAGHIPGAINVPYAELLEASDGRYLPEADLLKKLHAAGVPEARDADIIVYCNGGISATVPLTALERLGYRKVSLYDGSWNEWGNDASLPIQAADR